MSAQGPIAASTRARARLAGLLFIATFVTAIAGAVLYGPVLDETRYIVGPGADKGFRADSPLLARA